MILLRQFFIALLFLVTLNSSAFSSVLDEIVQNGVLKVGTTGDFPGWSFKNPETNQYEGFDIDVAKKLRGYVSINVQSGEALDTHSFATLIGVGATTVNPYIAFDSLYQRHEKKLFGQYSFDECVERRKQIKNVY